MIRSKMSTIYCRFCAEEKLLAEVSVLTTKKSRKTIIEKLIFIGVFFVDFSNKILPEAVCEICNELINTSYDFFLKAKRSQTLLSELYETKTQIDLVEDKETIFVPIKEESHGNDATNDDNSIDYTELIEDLSWVSYPCQCSICGHNAESIYILRQHCMSVHSKCSAFKCMDCTIDVHGFDEFVKHAQKHRDRLRKYCEYCNIKMENRSHRKVHFTADICTFCGQIFDNNSSLYTHLKKYSAKATNLLAFDVEIAKKYSTKATNLLAFDVEIAELNENHISNWTEYPNICKFCGIKVVDKGLLSYHCIEVHRKCFGMKCIDCTKDVSCFKDFVEHVKKHRPSLKTVCPNCDINMQYEDIAHINAHSINKYPCDVCGAIFPSKQTLKAHKSTLDISNNLPKKRRKGPVTVKDLTCQTCGILMKTPASLKTHLITHTARQRDHTCDRCGKAFYTKSSLEAHNKTHQNYLKETCKICQKSFLTLTRLRKHVKTHNLEMPYQCDDCKRFFSSKDRLREHVKVHLNIKPFQCEYCPKKFRFKNMMKTHQHQHTGAKPYSCNICCMEFTDWSNCNKHMKRKHGSTLAKAVRTPHGKLDLNPSTGKPDLLVMDNVVKEWSEQIMIKSKWNVQTVHS